MVDRAAQTMEQDTECFKHMPRSATAGSEIRFPFRLLCILHTGFHSGCSSLHPKPSSSECAPLHPGQHSVLVVLPILAILTGYDVKSVGMHFPSCQSDSTRGRPDGDGSFRQNPAGESMQTGALNALQPKVALAAGLVGFKKDTKCFGYKRLKKQDGSGLIAAKPRNYSLIG